MKLKSMHTVSVDFFEVTLNTLKHSTGTNKLYFNYDHEYKEFSMTAVERPDVPEGNIKLEDITQVDFDSFDLKGLKKLIKDLKVIYREVKRKQKCAK